MVRCSKCGQDVAFWNVDPISGSGVCQECLDAEISEDESHRRIQQQQHVVERPAQPTQQREPTLQLEAERARRRLAGKVEVEFLEDASIRPVCPHCEAPLDKVYAVRDTRWLNALGRCYICQHCHKVLGFSDWG